MNNYWLMTIGINQYQYLQPLGYAQADAQALWNFLVGKAGFMPDRCLLLTDTSPFIEGQSTYPTRENIQLWIDWLSQEALKQGDHLWVFFSGYGLKSQGQDYLMPVDGNPENITSTAIPMRSIYESLKRSKASTHLVLLDMNRTGATEASGAVGAQTVELARDLEIPTVLSCQPNQISHEASDLQHGLFTAALLEGLRTENANMSLATLKRYLSERLPELSEHHWRPRQEPVVVVHPPGKSHQVILPQQGVLVASGYYENGERNHTSTNEVGVSTIPTEVVVANQSNILNKGNMPSFNNPFDGNLDDIEPRSVSGLPQPPVTPASVTPTNGHAAAPTNIPPNLNDDDEDDDEEGAFWQNLLLWGGGLLLLVLLLMSLFGGRNRLFPIGQQANRDPAKVVPAKDGTAKPAAKPKSQEEINQERLQQARVVLRTNQVSQYVKAIAIASQIEKGQPLYKQAQDSIERWSNIILDTAKGRAQQGNYSSAVAAARLVPKDPQPIYAEAQKSIKQWEPIAKQQQANQTLLKNARGMIRAEQASTYNKAIVTLRKIPAGQPGHSEAQKLIAQWSQTIYSLALNRASGGNLQAGIDTASLIPPNTPAYAKAKQAMAKWKKIQAQANQ